MIAPTEQINLYIAEQDEWKRKLLVRLRQLIHHTDSRIEETWRWNSPHFDMDGIMVGLHGHKTFVSVWFHKGALVKDPKKLFEALEKGEDKGIRAYKLHEGDAIDEKGFVDLLKQAIKLNEQGVKLQDAKPARKALEVPEELEAVLHKDEQAWDHWEHFSYSCKKEYVEWITDAKQDETRKRRVAQAYQMIREGKTKNDKYQVH